MPRKPKSAHTPPGINKTNLPTGQAYGARGGEARSLQAMPAPTPQNPVAGATGPPSAPSGAPAGGPPQPQPQSPMDAAAGAPFTPVGLGDPSQRPNEPVTAGMPSGPGSNQPPSLIAPQASPPDQTLALLLAAQRANPSPGLAQIIARYQVLNGLT